MDSLAQMKSIPTSYKPVKYYQMNPSLPLSFNDCKKQQDDQYFAKMTEWTWIESVIWQRHFMIG